MKGTGVVWILIEIHGNILIQAGQSLVALLSVGPDTEGMIIGKIGLVVDECCLVGGREITTLAVVVPTAVEELSVTVRKRLSKFLSSKVYIRVEI